ncbi:SOS-response transcriptional repressor LexA [Stenotrophomonas sp. 2619]|uniref:S24 family peptidase n=1 Tax=Stenotrophomonas sp. 2619 TaxID=3156316 RepID=UPI003392FFC4
MAKPHAAQQVALLCTASDARRRALPSFMPLPANVSASTWARTTKKGPHIAVQALDLLPTTVSDGDTLVVDRSVSPQAGDLVIAVWDGNQPSCKVLKTFEHHLGLHSANPAFPPIVLDQGTEVEVVAAVGVVRQIQRRRAHGRTR